MSAQKIILISCLSISLLASITSAENENYFDNLAEDPNFYYMQLNVGVSSPSKPKGELIGSLSRSTVYEFEIGYKLYENLRLGFDVAYRPNFTNQSISSTPVGYGQVSLNSYNYKIKSFSAMLNATCDLFTINKITPYINASAGIAHNTTSSTETQTIGGSGKSDTFTYPIGKANNFAYKFGVGTRFEMKKNLYFDLHYQFVDLGKITTSRTEFSNGVYNTKSQNGRLRSHEALLGLVYAF